MTGDRTSRRGILAAIALTDNLPMPKEVTFYEHRDGLNLSFDTVEQGAAWCRFLGYETGRTCTRAAGTWASTA
jgi:hypothetical protein